MEESPLKGLEISVANIHSKFRLPMEDKNVYIKNYYSAENKMFILRVDAEIEIKAVCLSRTQMCRGL